jgi:hypothetical protein
LGSKSTLVKLMHQVTQVNRSSPWTRSWTPIGLKLFLFFQNYCLFNYMIIKIDDRKINQQPNIGMFFLDFDSLIKVKWNKLWNSMFNQLWKNKKKIKVKPIKPANRSMDLPIFNNMVFSWNYFFNYMIKIKDYKIDFNFF